VNNKAQEDINAIIILSRQVMSLLQDQLVRTENGLKITTTSSSEEIRRSQLTDEKLSSLVSKRNALISQLFETYTQLQLGVEITFINELLSLDKDLTLIASMNKKELTEQILKLKKSKKVSNLYKKF
jgi:hypothetical protein